MIQNVIYGTEIGTKWKKHFSPYMKHGGRALSLSGSAHELLPTQPEFRWLLLRATALMFSSRMQMIFHFALSLLYNQYTKLYLIQHKFCKCKRI